MYFFPDILILNLIEGKNLCTSAETCQKCLLKGGGCYWCTTEVRCFVNQVFIFLRQSKGKTKIEISTKKKISSLGKNFAQD